MIRYCCLREDGVCRVCGRQGVRRQLQKCGTPKPRRPSLNRSDCTHLTGPTDRDATQTGCGGCGMKLTSIWTCELHGDCAPFAKGTLGTEGVVKCRECLDFSTNADGG